MCFYKKESGPDTHIVKYVSNKLHFATKSGRILFSVDFDVSVDMDYIWCC